MRGVDAPCPSCGSRDLQEFYAVDNVTVNSCLVVDSAAEGRAFPRGDLRVAVCTACGLMSNTAFELKRLTYDSTYEETQTFSPSFNLFQDELIRWLLEKYDLRGKTVIDVGCGKGTFLARLAELGAVHGIGIDPSAVQDRLTGIAADHVRFINEFYSRDHASIPMDLLACRHALEHIPDVSGMLATVRDAVGDRPTPIMFELPESLRILREAAYWDIYYEHCNYFTPGSLARAFERSGFEVTDVKVEYEDQYLILGARTGRAAGRPFSEQLDQPEDIVGEVAAFEHNIDRKVSAWRSYFAEARQRGIKVAIWGSGSKCVSFLTTVGVDEEVAFVTDVNPYRHGKFLVGTGKEIVAPERFKTDPPDEIIVMNPIYRDEIAAMLERMDVRAGIITAEAPLEELV
jgi:SAM-dependent methyltransferase